MLERLWSRRWSFKTVKTPVLPYSLGSFLASRTADHLSWVSLSFPLHQSNHASTVRDSFHWHFQGPASTQTRAQSYTQTHISKEPKKEEEERTGPESEDLLCPNTKQIFECLARPFYWSILIFNKKKTGPSRIFSYSPKFLKISCVK